MICALVGFFYQKCRQQIARGADDFDAVVTGLLRQLCTVGVISNLFFDARLVQFVWRERTDAGANRRGRHSGFVISQRAHVQNLQTNLAVGRCRVNGVGDNTVTTSLFFRIQFGCGSERLAVLTFEDQPTLFIG